MEIIEINIETDYSSKIPNSKGYQNGIAFAMYLRRVEKIKNPILFDSTNAIEDVLNYPNSNIINAIGHSFHKRPPIGNSKETAIEDLHPLIIVE
jgi:hypothetical protein